MRQDMTQSERRTYQSLRARGLSHEEALSDALDGVDIEEARKVQVFAVTFGQKYRFDEHPACARIDNNSFLRVIANDELEARHKVIDLIGNDWAFIYEWSEFEPQIEEFGLWDVTKWVALAQEGRE